ncbi:MAG: hypothetical protein QXJ28_01615 [Candidatus Pacearchaeota archaeon]
MIMVKKMKKEDRSLRGDGKLPVIKIEAENLAEATYKAIISCYDYGIRVETPKHRSGMILGYDADVIIRVNNPNSEPKVFLPGIHDDARGVMQYILEVTHGIHNHWKKSEKNPEFWGYTYNERIVDQLPFVFDRIKKDWKSKFRISGRDYQFTTWRAGEDIIPEQEDPPCWQRGQLRFLEDKEGRVVMNYITDWRSRDLFKAWNENNIAQIELMKLLRDKISQDIINHPIELGAYIDRSSSLHLYGLYFERDGLEEKIHNIRNKNYNDLSMSLNDFFEYTGFDAGPPTYLKKLIYAQLEAEFKGHGMNRPKEYLEKIGYKIEDIQYPKDWDSWPKEWNVKGDRSKLAKVNQ